jgi:ABC-type transport system substrate-binding protein
MPSTLRVTAAVAFALLALSATSALAQKQGGTLRMYLWDNPPSASIHEEATISTVMPFMSLFNNLVLYDQHKELNTIDTIQPELATSWAWDSSKTKLTFKLRNDVKWHDGKPFTAKDVVCTLDKLQDKGADQFRKNPRKLWWNNLKEVTASGEHEVVFHLNRPPGPEGSWGMPPEEVAKLPGYDTNVEQSRAEARKIMEALGYGAGNRSPQSLSQVNQSSPPLPHPQQCSKHCCPAAHTRARRSS